MQNVQNYLYDSKMDEFSEYAEKNIIFNSKILKKNAEEKQKSLKEKEALLSIMKQKMEKKPENTYPKIEANNPNLPISNNNYINNNNIPINQTNMAYKMNNNNSLYQNYNLNRNNRDNFHSLQPQYQMSIPSQMLTNTNKPFNVTNVNYLRNNNNQLNNIYSLGGNNLGTQISNYQIYNQNPTMKTLPNNQNIINDNYYTNYKNTQNNLVKTFSKHSSIGSSLNTKIRKEVLTKSAIIERHAIILSDYYDYPKEEKEKHINQLLEEINFFGESTRKEIEEEKKLNSNKYISISEAMDLGKKKFNNLYNNEYYVLAILARALSIQGCSVLIEKDNPQNNEEKKEIFTTVQFLANGMYNYFKYIFYFDFDEQINEFLLANINERNNFNTKLKIKLLKMFNLNENDILMTNPTFDPYTITAIIKKRQYNEYSIEQLYQSLIKESDFNKIINIEKNILLSGCKLNKYMLDSRGNNKDGGWGYNEIRGGAPYYPPNGWTGYGIRVADRFDKGSNAWLDYNNSNGEWSVAYHGIGSGINSYKNTLKDRNDLFHLGQKVGEGVIVTPKPKVMEQQCVEFDCCGKKYKIGLMTRVMPFKIRCAEGQDDYWVINGTDNEIRPYRILIKEI